MSDFKTLLAVGDLASPKMSTVSVTETVRAGARKMAAEKTSSLLVVDAGGILVGLVTEQDIVYRAVAEDFDVNAPVKGIMTPAPLQIAHDVSIFEAKKLMLEHNVHHLIVVREGKPMGILTSQSVMGG
ncbi:MAG: CBS domain-containing protein [Nitrospinae bacterium]|nr:CBS domain-containing protein [Nitrospinota bacterium]